VRRPRPLRSVFAAALRAAAGRLAEAGAGRMAGCAAVMGRTSARTRTPQLLRGRAGAARAGAAGGLLQGVAAAALPDHPGGHARRLLGAPVRAHAGALGGTRSPRRLSARGQPGERQLARAFTAGHDGGFGHQP